MKLFINIMLAAIVFCSFGSRAAPSLEGRDVCMSAMNPQECLKIQGCDWNETTSKCMKTAEITTRYHNCYHSHLPFTCEFHSNCYWDYQWNRCAFIY